jgi:hypothetical protein
MTNELRQRVSASLIVHAAAQALSFPRIRHRTAPSFPFAQNIAWRAHSHLASEYTVRARTILLQMLRSDKWFMSTPVSDCSSGVLHRVGNDLAARRGLGVRLVLHLFIVTPHPENDG